MSPDLRCQVQELRVHASQLFIEIISSPEQAVNEIDLISNTVAVRSNNVLLHMDEALENGDLIGITLYQC